FEKLTFLPKVLALPQTSHLPATAGLPSKKCNRRETDASDGRRWSRLLSMACVGRKTGVVSGRRLTKGKCYHTSHPIRNESSPFVERAKRLGISTFDPVTTLGHGR